MRTPARSTSPGLRFNITPLIDVVFLLVIFFLVASHFSRMEPAEAVELPSATQTAEDENPRRLTITIQQDGDYYVGARQVTIDEISRMIEQGAGDRPETYAVRIRGDRETPYAFVEPIMIACIRNQVTTFGFNVLQE